MPKTDTIIFSPYGERVMREPFSEISNTIKHRHFNQIRTESLELENDVYI